ncbi:MAG: hypothetical protein ACHQ53_01845 [Polyangiales bacterium]
MDRTLKARTMAILVLVGTGCPGANEGPALGAAGQGVAGQGAGGQVAISQGAAGSQAVAGNAAPATGDVGFATTVQPFINKACNCHQSTPVLMAPFSLKVGEAYGNLVNVPSMQVPSMVRVKPGSTSDSYLWHKIDGTQLEVGGSGMIMPFTFPLNPDEKAIFERWITAGAPP